MRCGGLTKRTAEATRVGLSNIGSLFPFMLMVNGSVPHPHRAPNILQIFHAPALEFLPVDVERCRRFRRKSRRQHLGICALFDLGKLKIAYSLSALSEMMEKNVTPLISLQRASNAMA